MLFNVFEPKLVDSLLYAMIEFFNHGIQGTATWSQLSLVPLTVHNKKVIDENTIFDNGGINLHITIFAQGCHEDNPTRFLQGAHGKPNSSKKPCTLENS